MADEQPGATIEDYLVEDRTFPPPEDFKEARWSPRRSSTTRPTRTGRASGPGRPPPCSTGTRSGTRSSSGTCPFAKWFVGGKLNVCHNAVDRHVAAGPRRQGRLPLGGRARRHPHDHLRRPPRRRAALRQRPQGPRRRQGRPRLHLHADDPRAPGGDAGLRPHRRAALGGVRRLQPRLAHRPHQRRRVQGGRSPPTAGSARGAPSMLKPNVDVAVASHAVRRARRRRATRRRARRHGRRAATTGGTTSWPTADAECPCEPMDSEDLLYLLYTSGTTAKPKGIMHTTGGYLTQVAFTHKYVFDLHPDTDVYWCAADIGWVTGHSYIVYGPLTNGATSVIYEGTPDTPGRDRLWDIAERYGVTILYTAPTAIRTFMKWGTQEPGAARPVEAAAARQRRRAHQPRGVDVVPRAHRRRPLPDRRHVVADRDRRHHDQPAARRHHPQAGLGHLPAARHRGRGGRRRRQPRRARRRLPHPHPPVAVDAARHLRRPRALPARPTGRATRAATSPATAASSTTTATSGCSAGSTT